jgi:hypothetical protein
MPVKFSNNAVTTLTTATLAIGATSFTVASLSNFPTLASGDWTYLTIDSEVIKVTAVNTATKTFTCIATTVAHSSSDSVELRMTAELLDDFNDHTNPSGLFEHESRITANYSITDYYNAISGSPITISSGISVTVPTNSTWTIV